MRKTVIFVADSLDNAHKFQQVLSALDVEVAAGSSSQFKKLLTAHPSCDLVVYEMRAGAASDLSSMAEDLAEGGAAALLVIAGDDRMASLRLPERVESDFVSSRASVKECAARVGRLLRAGDDAPAQDVLSVDSLTINLATYQVSVGGEPLDLTYLEYALLAFLATHPGRTYSRDALLRHVWGFDYYGGSRTVDVHVRRIRAKLGPDLSHHLETVRGVGYLWNA